MAWQRAELPARASPLTPELMMALVGWLLSRCEDDVAVVTRLSFHCLLRTGEVLTLTKNDILISKDCTSGVVNLGWTMSGQLAGLKESVTINDKELMLLLTAMLKLQPSATILRRHPLEFRRIFQQALVALELQEWCFKPYSLRRRGATQHLRETQQLGATTVRGRWGHAKTARVYINEGLAVLASIGNDTKDHPKVRYMAHAALHFVRTAERPKKL